MTGKILQDFTHSAVPHEHAKLKLFYLTSVELAVAICVPVFVFGAQLGAGMEFYQLVRALIISGIFLGIVGGFTSYIGTHTRLSTGLLAQSVFGKKGGRFVQFILTTSLFVWFGLQTEVFAKSFIELLYHAGIAWNPPQMSVLIVSGFLMSSTAILRVRGVGKLAVLVTPLLLATIFYAVWQSFHGTDLYINNALEENDPMDTGTAIASIIGAYSIGLVVRPDIQRFAKNVHHSVGSAILSLGIGYPVLLLLAAYLANVTGSADFTQLLVTYAFGKFSLVMLLLAIWTTNDMNLYGASLNLATLFHHVPRWKLTAIAGLIGTVFSTFGLFGHVIALFSLMGVLTTPLLAAYGAKFIVERHNIVPHIDREGVHVPPFIIWAISSLVGIATTDQTEWGLGLMKLTGVSPLDSLIVASVLMTACVLWQKHREENKEFV
jgi:cytosine permease